MNKPLIPMKDYERIFKVLRSVSVGIGNIPGESCLFYNVIGSALLETNYKVKAQPVMGSAFIRVHDKTDTVLTYSHLSDGVPRSDNEAFHCWVQTGDFAVDFTAPEYNESLAKLGFTEQIPRRMFQRKLEHMAESHGELINDGDFYLEPNVNLTNELLMKFAKSEAATDLASICMEWYKKPPKKMRKEFSIVNDLGVVTKIQMSELGVSGAW